MGSHLKVTSQDYLIDSDESTDPLFYCLLADFKIEKDDGIYETKTCGLGFIFFGYHVGQGPFIYLEDLYMDESYRGFGGGKLMMTELARISLKLGCTKLSWSALDWNTPALNFYNKIGARIETNKTMTRFCGAELAAFAIGAS